jgi:cysteine desulfurase family protein
LIYLDNAATSFPKPREVALAMARAVRDFGVNPGRNFCSRSAEALEEIYTCRSEVASLFGVPSPEQVIFTQNSTMAINMGLKGILKYGDHVVISSLEHNAVTRPLKALERAGVSYSVAQVFDDDEATVSSFRSSIRYNTKMIVCNHASNVTGQILPAQRIGRIAKESRLLFMLDASQSAGVVEIDFDKLGVDILCAPGHKALYGPQGTGVLVLRKGIELDTIIEGGTGSKSQDLTQPDFLPDRFESGTINTPGIFGLLQGVRFVKKRGISNIFRHEAQLYKMLYEGVRGIEGISLYSPAPGGMNTAVLSFNVGGSSCHEVAEYLSDKGFCLRSGLHCAPLAHWSIGTYETGTVRASIGAFNTQKQIEAFISALKKFNTKK